MCGGKLKIINKFNLEYFLLLNDIKTTTIRMMGRTDDNDEADRTERARMGHTGGRADGRQRRDTQRSGQADGGDMAGRTDDVYIRIYIYIYICIYMHKTYRYVQLSRSICFVIAYFFC